MKSSSEISPSGPLPARTSQFLWFWTGSYVFRYQAYCKSHLFHQERHVLYKAVCVLLKPSPSWLDETLLVVLRGSIEDYLTRGQVIQWADEQKDEFSSSHSNSIPIEPDIGRQDDLEILAILLYLRVMLRQTHILYLSTICQSEIIFNWIRK